MGEGWAKLERQCRIAEQRRLRHATAEELANYDDGIYRNDAFIELVNYWDHYLAGVR